MYGPFEVMLAQSKHTAFCEFPLGTQRLPAFNRNCTILNGEVPQTPSIGGKLSHIFPSDVVQLRLTSTSQSSGIVVGENTGDNMGADGADAGANTGCDTGADTGCGTGADTGCDTGVDTGCDTGADTGCDTGADTGFDIVTDTGFFTGVDVGENAG
jgi:hypothetical protein